MKKVEFIIRPEKLDDLIVACEEFGISGLNINQISGYGQQKGKTKVYRGVKYEVKLKQKLKVETVIADDEVDGLIKAVIEVVKTGEVGDGKIFVYDIKEAVRIRTGESGEKAL